jgi:2-C-methyl-D-erythritol 4-phosphate cytidylyltransferase
MKVAALIVAAGSGQRMNRKTPKQFLKLAGKPILAHTLEVFEKSGAIEEIVLVVPRYLLEYCRKKIINKYDLKKVTVLVSGGKQRQDSVYEGLKKIGDRCQAVIIHDGVRPFVSRRMIEESIKSVKKNGAVIFALPAKETVKRVDKTGEVIATLRREELVLVQTPQVFKVKLIRTAYQKAFNEQFYGTDDAMLVERLGKKVKVLSGSDINIKITTAHDLGMAEAIMAARKKNRSN